MIDPNGLRAGYKRWNNPRFAGGKFYIPVLIGSGAILRTRRVFTRASEADAYSKKILGVWKRVYPMWAGALTPSPSPVGEGSEPAGEQP